MPGPGATFKRLMAESAPVVAPGVYDGLSAAMARRGGFAAVYASGGAIARSMGLPDLGLVTMSEMAQRLAQIVEAASVPVLADADTGHGTALHVRRTVRNFEAAGVAGLHIEDQGFPKRCGHLAGKNLAPTAEMAGKIKAAAETRRDPDFLIAARSDAIAVEGFEAAMQRAAAYKAAGADILFIEAPETVEQIKAIPEHLPGPLMINMFRGGRTPATSLERLGALGYALVIIPSDLQRATIQAMHHVLEAIRADGDSAAVDNLLAPLPARDE
ncbi:MAG TPA: oxaloacetate decarboxylase, partial [Afifellaceae bacterium]|nr:oxaloacetate decarboxylase [Afifellaceae bacterium]